jgi:CO dehydrogenase nickel-insertion accessory protein CooC1
MDLTYNLGINHDIPYLGESVSYIKDILKIDGHYRDFFASNDGRIPERFSITRGSEDEFTKKFSVSIDEKTRIMSAGPHTEEVLHGNHCSHSLSTPLRMYLPLLALQENEFAVVDEKAGRDGVGTGTPTGFDIAYIVAEPTPHGLKAASQIAEILDFFETPYEFILNKTEQGYQLDEKDIWSNFLDKKPVLTIPRLHPHSEKLTEYYPYMEAALEIAKNIFKDTQHDNRYHRSVRKFKKQKDFLNKE